MRQLLLHIQTKQIKDDLTLQIKSDRENLVTMSHFAAKLYADGENYETVATVDATTAPGYYSADNTCTLPISANNVKYIKLTFTGNAQAGNTYVALYDIAADRLEESSRILETINQNVNNGRAVIKSYLGVENRKKALRGARFVVNAIQVGHTEANVGKAAQTECASFRLGDHGTQCSGC